jgi:LPS-assembly lipoprotein
MTRRIVLALPLLALVATGLGGCGFEPLYGRFGDVSIADDLAQIRIQPIANRSGQILRNHLIDGLQPRGESQPTAYTLAIELIEPQPQDLGISRTESVVRYGYVAQANCRLLDASGREIWRGRAASSTSYEVTNSQFATLAGLNNARDRVMEEISIDVKAQLAALFRARRALRNG